MSQIVTVNTVARDLDPGETIMIGGVRPFKVLTIGQSLDGSTVELWDADKPTAKPVRVAADRVVRVVVS